jgi:glutaredoxin
MIMKAIRWFLGRVILLLDAVFKAKPEVKRTPDAQSQVDKQTHELALYQFEACPFCVKTRRAISRLDLKIQTHEASPETSYSQELLREGGQLQVPCLKIKEADGSFRWMYESDEIIGYLKNRFGA